MPFDQVMHKWAAGTLKSGSGAPVKSQKQAIAIELSEKRKADSGERPEYQSKAGFHGIRHT